MLKAICQLIEENKSSLETNREIFTVQSHIKICDHVIHYNLVFTLFRWYISNDLFNQNLN